MEILVYGSKDTLTRQCIHREVLFFMCRNIKTLFNFDPPVTDEEVRAASLQFVRKITGFNKPSKANTTAPAKNREEEAAKAKARAAERFAINP